MLKKYTFIVKVEECRRIEVMVISKNYNNALNELNDIVTDIYGMENYAAYLKKVKELF